MRPNQWNTITLEGAVQSDGVNGFRLLYGNPTYSVESYNTPFPGTIYFDGNFTVEKVASADVSAKGLKTSDSGAVKGFQISGADGVFYDATAAIDGNTITVSSENVPSPVEVRYSYKNWEFTDVSEDGEYTFGEDTLAGSLGGNVVNTAGIPMAPFKATLQDADIVSASLIDGYSYKVNLASVGYNAVTGKVVAVL